nr:nuclear transport factor 2 family protein [uncultured Flavobacterium sp.]
MNLPNVIADLAAAQNNFDSLAYANCFSETAMVFDEGKTHTGKTAIKNWIEKANQEYKAVMKPLEYSAGEQTLEAEISGNFAGSPIVLTYQFELKDGQIQSLKIG